MYFESKDSELDSYEGNKDSLQWLSMAHLEIGSKVVIWRRTRNSFFILDPGLHGDSDEGIPVGLTDCSLQVKQLRQPSLYSMVTPGHKNGSECWQRATVLLSSVCQAVILVSYGELRRVGNKQDDMGTVNSGYPTLRQDRRNAAVIRTRTAAAGCCKPKPNSHSNGKDALCP